MARYNQNTIPVSHKNKLMDDVARYKQYADNSFELGRRLLEFCNKGSWGTNITGKSQCHKMFEYMNEISGKLSGGYLDTNLVNKAINYNTSLDRNAFAKNISKVYDDCLGELRRILTLTHSNENQNGSELEHYGRLGMKWGMHIFGKEHVYKKSVRKLGKIDRKKNKFEAQKHTADTLTYKNYQKGHNWFRNLFMSDDKRNQYINTAREYKELSEYYKQQGERMQYIGERLGDAMDSVLGDMKLESFKPDDIYLGEKYCVDVIKNNRDMRLKKEG